MSATATNAKTNASAKTKRVPYGFALNFPQTFTMRQLRNLKGRKIKYITLYMRVKTALKAGEIVVVGKQEPKNVRKGRKELIYARVNAKKASAVHSVSSKDAVAMLS